jgi:hypothetical protein
MEALDFVVVSPTLWGFFCDHYGGGPAIERLFPNKQSVLVIATQRISGIELYPLFVDIHLAQSSTICTLKHKQFMVSKTWSLRQVLQSNFFLFSFFA